MTKWNLMVQWSILVAWSEAGEGSWLELFKALRAGRTLIIWRSLELYPWQVTWVNAALCWSFTDIVLLYFSQWPRNAGDPRFEPNISTSKIYEILLSLWILESEKEGLAGGGKCWYPGFCLRLLSQHPSWHLSYCACRLCRLRDVAYTVVLSVILTFSLPCW